MASTAASQHDPVDSIERRETLEMPLDSALLAEARELELDLADVFSDALQQAVITTRRARQFYQDNKEAFDAHNAYVEKHGLILDRLRRP